MSEKRKPLLEYLWHNAVCMQNGMKHELLKRSYEFEFSSSSHQTCVSTWTAVKTSSFCKEMSLFVCKTSANKRIIPQVVLTFDPLRGLWGWTQLATRPSSCRPLASPLLLACPLLFACCLLAACCFASSVNPANLCVLTRLYYEKWHSPILCFTIRIWQL